MNPEIDIYGVYLPSLGIMALLSYFLNLGLHNLINRTGWAKYIWHRALFDAASYFVILGLLALISIRI